MTPYFNEPGFVLYNEDSLEMLSTLPDESVDLIFADPPYFLSNGGTTCHSGKRVSVNKGKWDESMGVEANHQFNLQWLRQCHRLIKPTGSIFVSGTFHIIHSIGFAMQQIGYRLLNDISWYKINPPPNLGCRCFTHACETILWASKSKKAKYVFNYKDMKAENNNKQMKSLWNILPPGKTEKIHGKHVTQKPLVLLERIIKSASNPNDLIFDPFCGSGTTGIAAVGIDRRFVGIDNDSESLDLAILRYGDS